MIFEAIGGEWTGATVGMSCGSGVKIFSTRRLLACMMQSAMKQQGAAVVRCERCFWESGVGVLHTGICEGEPRREAGLFWTANN